MVARSPVTEIRCWRCGTAHPADHACGRCGNAAPAPPARGDAIDGLPRGLAAPFRGVGFVSAHPALWPWIAIPLAMNALLLALATWGIVLWLTEWMPDLTTPWPAWIDWLREAAGWLLQIVLWLVGILAGLIATLLLSGLVNAPFYDKLSEVVEDLHFGEKAPERPWSALLGDIARAVSAGLSLLARQATVMAVLFLLSFTAVGAPLFALGGFYYAGLGMIDVTLGRKLYPGRARARWTRRHWPLLVGLGVPVSLMPLLAPFGIVGATLAFLDDPDKEEG